MAEIPSRTARSREDVPGGVRKPTLAFDVHLAPLATLQLQPPPAFRRSFLLFFRIQNMGNKQSTPTTVNAKGDKWKRFGSKGSRSSSQKSDRGSSEKARKTPVQEPPVPESRTAIPAVGAVQLEGTYSSSTTTTTRQNDPPMPQSSTVPCQVSRMAPTPNDLCN